MLHHTIVEELVYCLLRASELNSNPRASETIRVVSERIYLVEHIGLLASQILQSTTISLRQYLPSLLVLFMLELNDRLLPPEIKRAKGDVSVHPLPFRWTL